MKTAIDTGFREDFLQQYQGAELDPNWMRRVARLAKFGWKRFLQEERDTVKALRSTWRVASVFMPLPSLGLDTWSAGSVSDDTHEGCRRAVVRLSVS